MDLSFYPLTLEAIDQAAVESLCLFIAADERPLTGLAGLADWRLSGRLSRLLRSGLLTGEAGEAVLTPPGSRMSFRKMFLFGVGKTGQSDEQLAERVAQALRKLAQAGVKEAALQLPARLSIEAGIRTLIDELQGPGRAMVFGPDPQRLVTALSQAAARGQVRLERPVVKVPTPASVPILPALNIQPGSQPALAQQPAVVQPIAVAQPIPVAPAVPTASPLPFAPEADRPTPTAVPKATPLPSGPAPQAPAIETSPAAQPLPAGPSAPPPAAETTAAQPPPPAKPAPPIEATQPPAAAPPAPEERRPAPPPPQRYVPPPPKPHVFETGKGRKKK